MPRIVNLKEKPYNLSDDQILWVENTIKSMSDEEKIGQLFFNLFSLEDRKFTETDLTNREVIEKYHIGGARYQGGNKKM